MELGVGSFTCQTPPFDERSWSQIYPEMIELAGTADEAGLDSVWVSEHHFTRDGYMSGPLPALGGIAAATEDIDVGTAVSLLPLHDPVRIAEDAATVDLLSGGRLRFGAAIGYRREEFDAFGVPRSERAPRLEDGIRFLRHAWSDGPLDYESRFHDVPPDVTVTPKPEAVPHVAIGGAADPAIRRAARLGDGWLALPTESPGSLREKREEIEAVREEAGIDAAFTVYPGARGFVADSEAEAWEAIKESLLYLRRRYAEFGLDAAQAFADADRVADLSPDLVQQLKDEAIYGTPEQVAAELQELSEAAGENAHFLFRVFLPGVDYDAVERCLELLGDEVQPALR